MTKCTYNETFLQYNLNLIKNKINNTFLYSKIQLFNRGFELKMYYTYW